MMASILALLLPTLLCTATARQPVVREAMVQKPLVGAFYFGDWHVNEQMAALHGANWTEFEVAVKATPRFAGHRQPNIPLEDPAFGMGQNVSEDLPDIMSKKIAAATSHGVDFFLFDWYWYASPAMGGIPDLQGPGGGTFLAGPLERGFLQAPNRHTMQFALMWANQDWVDVHPAKRGWNGCYRGAKDDPVSGPGAKLPQLQMFDGYMSGQVYRNAFRYIAKTYFTQPNYYKAQTRLANGSMADCCFFSFYQPEYIADGNDTEAAVLMDEFRQEAEAVGQCLHLNHMTSSDALLEPRRVDSRADYGWVKMGTPDDGYTYPETPYEQVMEHCMSQYEIRTAHYAQNYSIPYIPTLSTGFDSSPRTLPSDSWPASMAEAGQYGYPWGTTWTSDMDQWTTALQRTKAALAKRCAGGWCPPLLINAWNEWSEGCYLEPDERYGWGRLEAVKRVFGAPA